METKANPYPNGCLARALPDEPMFILLARDPAAPKAIRCWADFRLQLESAEADADQIELALADADAFENWRLAHDGDWRVPLPDPDSLPDEPTPSDELASLAGRVMGRGNPIESPPFVRGVIDRIAAANSFEEAKAALEGAFGVYIRDGRSLAGFVLNADPGAGHNVG